jgi:putative tryptophan/tyrosine transport system substrate-binding protein
MRSACAVILLIVIGIVTPDWVHAQKVYRIGALVADDQFVFAVEGFKKRMAHLGYVEGKNVSYNFQNSKGDQVALKKMGEMLIHEKPDLIVTSSTTATVTMAQLTAGSNFPVVFLSAGDPLRVVKSYASSGNNLTGISTSSLDLIDKRMELLKNIAPKTKRVILLVDPVGIGINHERFLSDARHAAKRLNMDPVELQIQARNAEEMKEKIPLIKRSLGDALFLPPEATVVAATEDMARQVIKEKLPHVGPNVETVKRGLLAGYSSNYFSLGEQGAVLVDKVLKGARPTDLPVEQPFKLHLMLNLKTAKAIGIEIPSDILLQADEVFR